MSEENKVELASDDAVDMECAALTSGNNMVAENPGKFYCFFC